MFARDCVKRKDIIPISITKNDDILTQYGMGKAIDNIRSENDIIWHSQPCTGGCPWQVVNWNKSENTRDKIKGHGEEFVRIWKRFVTIAKHAIEKRASIFIE